MGVTKRTMGLYSTGGTLLVAAICVLLNLVSTRFFTRFDCTENKIYSLSPSTSKILSSPTDPVRVKVFFDENVPAEYLHHRRYLSEMLDEMISASRGKLRAEFADMKQESSREEAIRAGISPLRFTSMRKDKFEIQEGFMGLVIYYEDKKEIIGAVTQIASIEYEIAGRIVKLTRTKRPVVVWTTGHGEYDAPEPIRQYLAQNFDLHALNPDDDAALWRSPDSSAHAALVIAGPKSPFSDTALKAIDQVILAGVPTALLVDFYDVNMGNFFVRPVRTGLDRLIRAYGVEPREGLILDAQNMPVQIQSQQGFFTVQSVVNYPFIPRVTSLSREHVLTRAISELALPFVSAMETRDSAGVTILASSSEESYRMDRPFVASPTQRLTIDGLDKGPFVLGVAIQGVRRSAYADTVPAVRTAEGAVRLMVMGNAQFLDDNRGGGPANMSFAANMVDWLAASEDLISIRSKSNTYRPLENVSDERRNLIKVSNMFLMPAMVVLFGAGRWRLRLSRRRRWESKTRKSA